MTSDRTPQRSASLYVLHVPSHRVAQIVALPTTFLPRSGEPASIVKRRWSFLDNRDNTRGKGQQSAGLSRRQTYISNTYNLHLTLRTLSQTCLTCAGGEP